MALLEELHLRYMLIGGLAVAQWGEPRATLDVDLTVWVDAEQFEATIRSLGERLMVRAENPLDFARKSRVLPVVASNGVLVDILSPHGRSNNGPSKTPKTAGLLERPCVWLGLTTCSY